MQTIFSERMLNFQLFEFLYKDSSSLNVIRTISIQSKVNVDDFLKGRCLRFSSCRDFLSHIKKKYNKNNQINHVSRYRFKKWINELEKSPSSFQLRELLYYVNSKTIRSLEISFGIFDDNKENHPKNFSALHEGKLFNKSCITTLTEEVKNIEDLPDLKDKNRWPGFRFLDGKFDWKKESVFFEGYAQGEDCNHWHGSFNFQFCNDEIGEIFFYHLLEFNGKKSQTPEGELIPYTEKNDFYRIKKEDLWDKIFENCGVCTVS